MRAGTSAVYVVSDDVDAVHRRVVDADGEVLEAPHESRFGSGAAAYVCTVHDPEGNLWTFGTYRGPSPTQRAWNSAEPTAAHRPGR